MSTRISVKDLDTSYVVKDPKTKKQVKFNALKNVTFEVEDGEFIAILGPSGCGKSTLLDVVSGLLRPQSGNVEINGVRVTKPSSKVGFVMQSYALLPWRTIRRNIEYGLEINHTPRSKRREISDRFLELMNLSNFADRYPYELSGGMKQRAAIARSLAYNPEVLLMDEPFAAVDAQMRETLQDELIRIWETTKNTILFVTHSIEEAVILADKIVVLTDNPGTVKKIIHVNLPRSRNTQEVRSSEQYGKYLSDIRELLNNEKNEDAEEDSVAYAAEFKKKHNIGRTLAAETT